MIFPSNIQDDAIAVRQMPSKWCSEGWLRRFLVGAMACMAVVLFAGCLSSSSNGDSGTGTQPPPPDEDGDGDGGTGLPPDGQIHINVTSPYDFGDVVLGQSSSVTVSIHNRVGEQIVLNPLDITGATDVFSSTGLSQQTVPENQFATFTISFNPQSEGDFQAVFAITVQSPDGPDDINLTVLGSGFEPELGEIGLDVSDPLRIIPAEIGVNTTRTITLTNIGNETLRLPENAITIAGDGGVFTVTQPGNLVLAPGQSTTFTVTVNPPATQTYEAIVTVNADPPSQPRSFQVIARGQIMLSLLDEAGRDYFSPDYGEFDFGVVLPPGVATRSQEFLIRNTGQNAIQLTGAPLFQLHGTGVDFFRIGGVADFLEQFPGGLIPGGATGRIRIIFSPEILNQVTADFRVPVSVAGVDEDMETVLIGNIPPDRMVVYGGGYIIEAGSTQPRRRDHTDFGDAELRTEETITR
ncbi:MAG: choice-of-anchor D domain-containing protein, partial [Planctomycetota bacterium]